MTVSRSTPSILIRLWEHAGTGLILEWPSGIRYTNQTGGTSCFHPAAEGVFVPIGNQSTLGEPARRSLELDLYEYFTGPRWRGSGGHDLGEDDADDLDAMLARWPDLAGVHVDRVRLADSHEAWLFVTLEGTSFLAERAQRADLNCAWPLVAGLVPFPRRAVLTWTNSD